MVDKKKKIVEKILGSLPLKFEHVVATIEEAINIYQSLH